MQDCIFCKIVAGKIPAAKVYEDKNVLAFLDIEPVNNGHTLVIPKKHYETILDIPEDLLQKVIVAVKKVARAVKQGVNADGINIGQSNFRAGGQEVFHIHFHIMPRFEDDGLKHWPGKKYEEEEMEKIAERIRNQLN